VTNIEALSPGERVRLRFCGSPDWGSAHTDTATFLDLTGTGDDRRARFESRDQDGRLYEWEAYIFEGDWAYGTSAERLMLLEDSSMQIAGVRAALNGEES
jgi:hypothetical protein